jgi:hypothetical protein
MKKLIYLLLAFISIQSYAQTQMTDAEMTAKTNQIKNASVAGENTKERFAYLFQRLIDSKINLSQLAYVVASGTDTYTATISPVPPTLTGLRVFVYFTNANTGAATININGLGVKDLISNNGGALSANDITAGEVKLISYNGTSFQLVGGGSVASASSSTAGVAKLYTSTGTNVDGSMDQNSVTSALSGKQATLVSGTNLKTVGGTSLLGSGNVTEVADAINDGTITIAPSQNAVFDALPGVRAEVYGAVGDGTTDNTTALQTAIDALDNVGKLVIGKNIGDVYLIDKPLVIPSNSIIEINGTIKLANGSNRLLTANVTESDNTLSVANASTYFKVGQKIVVTDDNQPVNGGGAWKTRKVGNTNIITAVNSTTITCLYTFSDIINNGLTTAANARVSQANSVFTTRDTENIVIYGTGVLEGNLVNQLSIAGATYNRSSEDLFSSCGVSFASVDNIKIKGITIKNFALHGIATAENSTDFSNDVEIDGVRFDGNVDKAIAGLNINRFRIANIKNINGVDEGEVTCYNGCTNGIFENGFSYGNRRYGLSLTGQDNKNITVNKWFSITSRDKAAQYNFYFQNQLYGTNISNITSTAEMMEATWTRVTTTCTVTTPVPHNLTNGQTIRITYSASTPAFDVGNFVITVTGASTFTFTCLNAGLPNSIMSYIGFGSSGSIVFNSCRNVDAKGLTIYNDPLSSGGLSIAATTAYATTSDDIRIDGLTVLNSILNTGTRVFSITPANRVNIENFSVNGVYRVFNDGASNGLIKFQNGYVANYTTLFETDNNKFIFSNVDGIVVENASSATIASGKTSVTINHLMTRTPLAQNIYITPTKLSNAAKWWVSDITATTFKINVDADPGAGTATFQWRIKTYEGTVTAEAAYTNSYTSDFSAGVDGWGSTNVVTTGNEDGISDGTTSYDNNLKTYANATNSTHDISKAIAFVGKQNRITFKYYIPSAQTNVNGFTVYANAFGTNVIDLRSGIGVVGTWTEVTSAYFTPTSTTMYFRLFKTFTSSYAGANSASDDRIFIKDIVVEYLP